MNAEFIEHRWTPEEAAWLRRVAELSGFYIIAEKWDFGDWTGVCFFHLECREEGRQAVADRTEDLFERSPEEVAKALRFVWSNAAYQRRASDEAMRGWELRLPSLLEQLRYRSDV